MTVINSNISALKAQSSLTKNARVLDTATERLSTGLRINSAKDDAAGLAITNRMTAQINGLNQAVRNANDGLAMIATIDGALTQSTAVLQRMRELAVQSANGTNSIEDRMYLQAEMTQLTAELDRISSQARFNGMKVLDGTFTNKQFQIGANGAETISLSVGSASSAELGQFQAREGTIGALTAASAAPTSTLVGSDITVSGYLGNSIATVDAGDSAKEVAAAVNNLTNLTGVTATALTKVRIDNLASDGAITFSLTGKNIGSSTAISANVINENDLSVIADSINNFSAVTGITAELSSDKTAVTLTNAEGYDIIIANFTTTASSPNNTVDITGLEGDATADSTVANAGVGTTRSLTSGSSDSTRVVGDILFTSPNAFTLQGATGAVATTDFVAAASAASSLVEVSSISISTSEDAQAAIGIIDGALGKTSAMRANLGAVSSRLEKTVDALTSSSVNTAAARSRILDTDYSIETSALAKSQIIAQASTAMLAQANQQPQQVLQLLKQ